MSVFDPESFMQTTIDGANDTKLEPIPVGEYVAVVEKIDIRSVNGRDGMTRLVLDVIYDIQDSEVKARLGRDKLTSRQSIFLDTTDSGSLDLGKGKNVGLGKLRAALDQNKPGWSFAMLNGAGPLKVSISHRPDKNDPEVIYSEVKSVGKFE